MTTMNIPSTREITPYLPLAVIGVGWAAMFGPAYWGLANTIWASDSNGHGPIILAVSLWLLWRKKDELLALPRRPATVTASVLMLLSVLMYVVGRSQTVWTLEIASQNLAVVALLLFFFGWQGVKVAWFLETRSVGCSIRSFSKPCASESLFSAKASCARLSLPSEA